MMETLNILNKAWRRAVYGKLFDGEKRPKKRFDNIFCNSNFIINSGYSFFAYLIVTFSDGHDIPFSDLVILAIVGVFMGLFLSSAITGEVLVFRFVWRTFSGFSIIFLLIMIIIGYVFG